MKIYLASSWRNVHQPRLVELLRRAGHEVYDFRNPPNKSGFGWEQTGTVRRGADGKAVVDAREYRDTLAHPIARAGYEADRGGIEWSDACVFIAPAGRSASWELGYATALDKLTLVHLADEMEPELMFFESTIVGSDGELLAAVGGVVLPADEDHCTMCGADEGCGCEITDGAR
jgi:nucleoside 2-deoxyribosyltransferase